MNDNKKIAINTVVLTAKLVITILCSFVISRLILKALGADNYGLYDVVGGIVGMLALLSTSMITTSYRYIAVEMGKGDKGDPQKIYSTLMFIHGLLAILLIIIGEPLGAYYINHYLNITNASVSDAHFVFVFSLLASFFSIIAVPSYGLLVAEEKFLAISIIDIFRSLFNVFVAIALLYYFGNRLRLYAVLMAVINIGNRLAFQAYCQKKYSNIVKFKFNKNKEDYKELASFTGWILLGASAVIGRTQGVAMIINLFFRNSINAAFGVANQIGNAAISFTNTLRQSVTPQIMKNQKDNSSRSLSLVYAISRYTFLIMLIISVPLMLCMDTILGLWLGDGNVPPLTKIFAIFLIIDGMIANLRTGFDASIQASGNIRKNQIGYTIINLSIIPIVYFLYRIGMPAYMNVVVGGGLCVVTTLFQAYIMQEQTDFTYKDYWNKTICPCVLSSIVSFVPMILLKYLWDYSIYAELLIILLCVIWTSICVFYLGMSKHEQESLISYCKRKFKNTNI